MHLRAGARAPINNEYLARRLRIVDVGHRYGYNPRATTIRARYSRRSLASVRSFPRTTDSSAPPFLRTHVPRRSLSSRSADSITRDHAIAQPPRFLRDGGRRRREKICRRQRDDGGHATGEKGGEGEMKMSLENNRGWSCGRWKLCHGLLADVVPGSRGDLRSSLELSSFMRNAEIAETRSLN